MSALDDQLHKLVLEVLENRSLREAGRELKLHYSGLSRGRLKKSFRNRKLVDLSRSSVLEISDLARKILIERGHPANLIEELSRKRNGHPILLDTARATENRRRADPATRASSLSDLYAHAALQLEASDFPSGNLASATFFADGEEQREIEAAATMDLLYAFVNAAYFASFATALRRRLRQPEFRRLPVDPFKCLELSDDFRRIPPEEVTVMLRAIGRSTRDIFHWTPQAFASFVLPALQNDGRVFEYLSALCRFDDAECEVLAEPQLVLASASVASFRASATALAAARTILEAIPADISDDLYLIASKIRDSCHFTNGDRYERAQEALRTLPLRDDPKNTDILHMREDLRMTVQATGRDDGVWFMVFDSCYAHVSRRGSILKEADDDENIVHCYRATKNEEGSTPTGDWNPGKYLYFP